MKYCERCVQPDTRPGVYFNEQDICGACFYQDDVEKTIDWDCRKDELKEIVEWAKKNTKSAYDCVIGVSGGKDSTFQALYTRDKLGLRPLLANSEPESISEIGRRNIENLKNLGFDVISIRPNPVIMKKLIKRDFYKYLNPIKVTEYTLYASAFVIAYTFKIPLIIQGENPTLTLGIRKARVGTGSNALNINKHDTISTDWEDYIGDGITEQDLFLYHYDREKMKKENFKGVWLQYYVKEWSSPGNAEFSVSHGLTIRPEYFNPYEIGTYAPYYQLDSDVVQVNQMLKHIKFGFGQCTDHACYDIRAGRLTRKEAVELVKKYDGKCGIRYIKLFCDYIGISMDEFWRVANSFRGHMWIKSSKDEWILKNPIWEQEE